MSNASLELGGGNWAAKVKEDGTGNLLGYAVGDTSGKYLPREFTFSRGADIGATRVNKDGLIEKFRENLLTYSNQFDTTWTLTNTALTSGQSGYDGSSDAWLLSKTNIFGRVEQSVSFSGVHTISVYAKAASKSWIRIRDEDNRGAYFDLSGSGAVGTTNLIIDANIESVGSGWFRCSVTGNFDATDVLIYVADDDDDTSDTSGSIYIQDAQLEQGLVATDYLESDDETGKAGVLENLPRIDYTGGSASLLLEPQRANLVANSEYHSGIAYGNNQVTTTDNEAVSPEGVQNAAKIVLDSGTNASNGGHYLTFSSTAGTTYTISVFAKAGEMRYFTFTYGSTSAGGGHFDLQEGTLLGTITNASYSDVTADIEDYGNGWYRLVVSLTDSLSVAGRFLSMKPSPSASVPSYNNYSSKGDGTSGAYIYGFQLEEGSYATSYIPTYGASVTRVFDDVQELTSTSSTGITNNYNTTVFFDGSVFKASGNTRIATLYDASASSNPRVLIYLAENSGSHKVLAQYRVSGQSDVYTDTGYDFTVGDRIKIATRLDGTSLDLFVNGVKQSTETIVQGDPIEVLRLMDVNSDLGHFFNDFQVFSSSLSDAECIALTTL